MNVFWKKHKEYIILIAIPIVSGAVFAFAAKYLIEEISSKNDDIKKEIIDHEERKKRLAEISNLEDQFKTIEKEKEKLEVFASQDKIISLIKELEEIAAETGNEAAIEKVEIQDENSKKEPKSKNTARNAGKNKKDLTFPKIPDNNYVEIGVKLQGSYNDAVNFIRKIENMNYCSDIISFQMSVREKGLTEQSSNKPYSRKSDFLVGKNSGSENNKNKIIVKKSTGESIINSALEIIFYLNK